MSRLASKIWYGTFHNAEDVHRPHLLPVLLWGVILLLLIALRLALPFIPSEPQLVHSRILDSLAAGQIWGRQALVGSPEFPPLPTLALFFARQAGRLIRLPGGPLLVAVTQVWAAFYVLRIPRGPKVRWLTGIALAGLLLSSDSVRALILRLDPNWATAVPSACGLYHFVMWWRWNSLRDAVLLGVNSGFLVFAGPAGATAALVLLAAATLRVTQWRRTQAPEGAETGGVRLLLWAPALYGLALLFVANWLVMRDAFFFLHRIADALARAGSADVAINWSQHLSGLSWLATGAFLVCVAAVAARKQEFVAAALAFCLLAIVICQAVLNGLHIYVPGATILRDLTGVTAVLMPFWTRPAGGWKSPWLATGMAVALLIMLAAWQMPQRAAPELALTSDRAPSPADVISAVDTYTPETRVMVYGLRVPANYLDVDEQRFLPRVDFRISNLRWRAREENYLYILVPPNDGTYYGRGSELADIHERTRPWLILEKQWPGEWQLWRVLNPARQ